MLHNALEETYVDQIIFSVKLARERRECIVYVQRNIFR